MLLRIDLGGRMRRMLIPYGAKIDVAITTEDRNLIVEHTYIDEDTARALNLAISKASGLVVRLSMEDLDDLIGHVAATANHAENRKLQNRFDEIFVRLKEVEDMYEEEEA